MRKKWKIIIIVIILALATFFLFLNLQLFLNEVTIMGKAKQACSNKQIGENCSFIHHQKEFSGTCEKLKKTASTVTLENIYKQLALFN